MTRKEALEFIVSKYKTFKKIVFEIEKKNLNVENKMKTLHKISLLKFKRN